jgi:hypothetical protein
MATTDMRKMGFRAGDWVVIRSKQVRSTPTTSRRLHLIPDRSYSSLCILKRPGGRMTSYHQANMCRNWSQQVDPELSPYEGLVVLRAWPGPTVPAGTVSA